LRNRKILVISISIISILLFTLTACGQGSTSTPHTLLPTEKPPDGAVTLAFTTQPSGATSGFAFTTQPAVTIEDSTGKPVTTANAPVTLFIELSAANQGSVLFGTKTIKAVNGVAAFSDLSIKIAGTYRLTATSPGLTAALSDTFDVVPGKAAKLGFSLQPAWAMAGAMLSKQPVVNIEDVNGNTVTDSSAAITLTAVSENATIKPVLSGRTTVNAIDGAATFSNLSITPASPNYVLSATSPGLEPATSKKFDIY
jgi:trimeric autotransporter adhesin